MNYFELYYAYLSQCEKENWANMRDPNHDYMEWNHTLPQCIFGDQPIGQWLTTEQHAIASCLQSVIFRHVCYCPWHKKHIPLKLWEITIHFCKSHLSDMGVKGGVNSNGGERSYRDKTGIFSITREKRVEINKKAGLITRDRKVGVFAPENLGKGCAVTNSQKWMSTLDGFISTAAGVASHNLSIGGTGKDKVKLTN